MEINNSSFQELSAPTSQLSEIESENEMSRELNDSELDAIAGGLSMKVLELLKTKYSTSSQGTLLPYPSATIPVINL